MCIMNLGMGLLKMYNLKATDIEVGLLLNFGPKPEISRKVFSHYYRERLQNNSESASSALSVSKK